MLARDNPRSSQSRAADSKDPATAHSSRVTEHTAWFRPTRSEEIGSVTGVTKVCKHEERCQIRSLHNDHTTSAVEYIQLKLHAVKKVTFHFSSRCLCEGNHMLRSYLVPLTLLAILSVASSNDIPSTMSAAVCSGSAPAGDFSKIQIQTIKTPSPGLGP